MLDTLIQAVNIVFKPEVLLVMLASSFYGIIIGAIPGLTAVMAVSLIMPIAIFLDPVPALAAIIACDAMAVFAGDIPGTLLRIPGTPASGAYTDDSYKLTQQGKAEMVLGANCFFSAIGGLFGLVVLVCAAPLLAEVALNFSTYEYFWLACLGLTCATFMTSQDKVKGIASLFLGLFITTIGYDSITGQPRFTFGSTELLAGIHVIPVLIGLFAVSEIMRRVSSTTPPAAAYNGRIGNIYTGIFKVWREHIPNFLRGNTIGVVVGALPGAGADIAAWLAYAISKKFSKTPEKFGTGIIDGICRPAKKPVFAGEEGICSGCGVATIATDYYELGRLTGELAAQILRGETDISTLPIQYGAMQKLYNSANCEALNITVPDGYTAVEG